MRTLFTLLLVLVGLAAAGTCANAFANARSAIHEIEALIALTAFAVVVGAGYVGVVLDEHLKGKK